MKAENTPLRGTANLSILGPEEWGMGQPYNLSLSEQDLQRENAEPLCTANPMAGSTSSGKAMVVLLPVAPELDTDSTPTLVTRVGSLAANLSSLLEVNDCLEVKSFVAAANMKSTKFACSQDTWADLETDLDCHTMGMSCDALLQ